MDVTLSRQGTILIMIIALVCEALFAPSSVAAHGEMARGPLPPDVRGTYQMASGDVLTLTGHYGMPSYELAGRRVFLRPVDDDRFTAWDDGDESLILERGADGVVLGLTLRRGPHLLDSGGKIELYDESDVVFSNGDVTLAGSLLAPTGDGPHPAVVIVHGAEAASRESYRLLASHFARRGVAALIYDKRGVGESGGSFRHGTFDDLAEDALAGLALLRELPTVDPDRVGMLGLSQGGWVISMAATRSHDVSFVIPISTSGFSPAVQDRWLNGNMISHRGLNGAMNAASERAWRMLLSTRQLVDAGVMPPMPEVPGFWFHSLDPDLDAAALWQGVRQPLLGIWGELDCQVPAHDSLTAVRDSLERSGHDNYTLVILPRADHSITLVAPCAQEVSGWSVLRVDYPAGYFDLLAEWVHEHGPTLIPARQVIQPDAPSPSTLGWHQPPSSGVGTLGSFVPQAATILTLLAVFAALVVASLVRSTAGLLRRRSARVTMLGAVAPLGLVAAVLTVASLAELLLLGSPDGGPLIGGSIVEGVTPLFALASAAITATLVVGAVAILRTRHQLSARVVASVVSLIVLAAWSAYWSFIPTWLVTG